MGKFELNRVALAACLLLTSLGCSSQSNCAGGACDANHGGASSVAGGGGASVPDVVDAFAPCGAKIFTQAGFDAKEYVAQANAWDLATIDCRLGPRYSVVHPQSELDTRPSAYSPANQSCDGGHLCPQYQAGPARCSPQGGCYGSDSGQVLYVPDAPTDLGVDRLQVYGWEALVHCYAPGPEPGTQSHPDPLLTQSAWSDANGGVLASPIALTRSAASWTNDAVVILAGGVIATTGTSTTGANGAFFKFPANKRPTALALSSSNEFLFVTIWDTDALEGELAVLSMRGVAPTAHTWPFHGLINAGGFVEMKLLGYVSLPFRTPTLVSVASDGHWSSPSDTAGMGLPAIQFGRCDDTGACSCDAGLISSFAKTSGDWSEVVAQRGYAIVASQWENRVAFVDLEPLFRYYRSAYFGSVEQCLNAMKQFSFGKTNPAPGSQPAADLFPYTFEQAPEQMPVVTETMDVEAPRAVLAGIRKDRWTQDVMKAYVASYSGDVHVYQTSSLIYRWWERDGMSPPDTRPPAEIGKFRSCTSPTSMRWLGLAAGTERSKAAVSPLGSGALPLQASGPDAGKPEPFDGLNNGLTIVCRGDREIDYASSWLGEGMVYRRFQDRRLGDPVDIDIADRADIRTVADFDGKKVVTYRHGWVRAPDCSEQDGYAVGPEPGSEAEAGGEYTLPGHVFAISTTNVN